MEDIGEDIIDPGTITILIRSITPIRIIGILTIVRMIAIGTVVDMVLDFISISLRDFGS